MKKNLHWLFWALITFLFAGCADTGEYDGTEEDVATSEEALSVVLPLSSDYNSNAGTGWNIAGISSSNQSAYALAISDSTDSTFIYTTNAVNYSSGYPTFAANQSTLPSLCRYTKMYLFAKLMLTNLNDLDTASITFTTFITKAKSRSYWNGTPRYGKSIEYRSFRDLTAFGVGANAFTWVAIELDSWQIYEPTTVSSNTLSLNASLIDYELWRKDGTTKIDTSLQAFDGSNRINIAQMSLYTTCE